ncbi:MAG: nitroreductase [Candidatus Omnitrophica bacterium]|nr:nitroreductase [Candidatus Omnitrophota bacterium]MCM8826842.1 nitroreductase [Candidatus Omnitrophota bacterium]
MREFKDFLHLVRTRRSIRRFKKEKIPKNLLDGILEAGRWAPSGLNNQPWRFKILGGKEKDDLANFTKYSSIVKSADKVILVFLDKNSSYHYQKDLMAIGACIENMLLYIHWQGWGGCWLGEILNRREEVNKFLGLKDNLELCGVIALGKPYRKISKGKRYKLSKLLL